jgi:hypothetical protein
MTTAGQIAQELRRIADAFDKEPETVMEKPMLSFHCNNYSAANKGKAAFLAAVRLLPKPLKKEPSDTSYEVGYGRMDSKVAVWSRAVIDRASVCTLIEPAKPAVYDCPSLLSVEEETGLVETGEQVS